MAAIKNTTTHTFPSLSRVSKSALPPRQSGVAFKTAAPVDTFQTGSRGLDNMLTQAKKLSTMGTQAAKPSEKSDLGKPSFLNRLVDVTGSAAVAAIGTIYATLGTVGEEKIGTVFNSEQAKALYDQPVDGPASKKLAQMEFDYWNKMKKEKNSVGGHLGSLFNPSSRDWLQREFFR